MIRSPPASQSPESLPGLYPCLLNLKVWGWFSSVQSLSRVWLFATPWTTACQASLSITNSQSLPKLMSIESVMPSNRLNLCRPLLLPPSVFPSIRVFSNELVLCIRWPKYWSWGPVLIPVLDLLNQVPQTGWLQQKKWIVSQSWSLDVWGQGVSRFGVLSSVCTCLCPNSSFL